MKQVIVLRKDLNMRKGKMVAQGSHASLTAFLVAPKASQKEWFSNGQTKICVGVDSEEELLKIHETAQDLGLPVALIRDAGHTEFDGPTLTAVCIGPALETEIDPITKVLKLL